MSLPTGTQLGPYKIVSLLGVGGMGEVYRAKDPRLDRSHPLDVRCTLLTAYIVINAAYGGVSLNVPRYQV